MSTARRISHTCLFYWFVLKLDTLKSGVGLKSKKVCEGLCCAFHAATYFQSVKFLGVGGGLLAGDFLPVLAGAKGFFVGGVQMIGGIIGDYVGSVYEGYRIKSYNFQNLISHHSRITDDSVQLCGTAEAILTDMDFVSSYRKWGRKYWDAGFSMHTQIWMRSDSQEYKNPNPGVGPATRSGLIGFLDLKDFEICELARESARASHSHEEAIQGAEAVAFCIYLIREGFSQQRIKEIIYKKFEYYLEYDYKELNQDWYFDTSAYNVVPVAIFIGLYAVDFEDLIRTVLYVGGDADSIGAIAGLIGQARFGVCETLKLGTQKYLFRNANDVLLLSQQFEKKYL